MVWWVIVLIIVAVLVGLIVLSYAWTKITAPGFKVDGKHVFITGGSTGLGLATAKKYAQGGAKVSIVSRSLEKLEAAKSEIEAVAKDKEAKVFICAADVTDYDAIHQAVADANAFHGRVTDHVVCCAGLATPGYFVDQEVSIFHKQMDLNYFGVVHTVKAAVPAMIEAKNHGRIVIVSSGAALISFIGYTQYASSKYALRGLGEAMRNEFQLYGIEVSMFFPANIDSPGFVQENKTKPEECKVIEGTASLQSPDKVAGHLIAGIADGQFAITNDTLIEMLRWSSNGVTPRWNTPLELLFQPIGFLLEWVLIIYSDMVVKKARDQDESKASAAAPEDAYQAMPDDKTV